MSIVASLFVFVLQTITYNAWQDFSKQLELWARLFLFNPLPIVQYPAVQALQAVSTGVALAALTGLVVVYGTKGKVDTIDGTALPASMLVKNALWAGIAVAGINLVATFAAQMSSDAIGDLLGMNMQQLFAQAFSTSPVGAISATWELSQDLLGLLCVFAGLGLVVQKAIMTGEFMILLVTGPLFAISLMHGGRGWSLWWRELVALAMTPVLQLLIIWLFCLQFLTGGGDASAIGNRIMSLGLLWLLMKMPRWTRAWVYVPNSNGNGGRAVASAALATARTLIFKA